LKIGPIEIKRVENTKWDYTVPLGLALLASFYYVFYLWNCFDCSLARRITAPENVYPRMIFETTPGTPEKPSSMP